MRMRKKLVIAAGAVGGLAIGSAAFAFFTTGGAGTGTATVGTSTNVTLELDGAVPALLPGAPAPIGIRVTNPAGAASQTVTAITMAVSGVAQINPNAPGPACTVDDFAVSSPSLASPRSLAAGQSAVFSGTLELRNLATNQDNCMGASVSLSFTAG